MSHAKTLQCSRCSHTRPYVAIPPESSYMCRECVEQHWKEGEGLLPPGTFKCCPTETSEGKDGVIQCRNCGCWYHYACLNITSTSLREYLSLSTTKWYCPEPRCAEKVIRDHVHR
ncbi:hypothetical protein AGDE_01001 [Angomonas deanei]|uniref:PHD-type domain-containing protein n=1 Tax=Angomonas deanei TaxID=59799 RepID=A0A7G2CFF0_9TRYP|nr:hypothetical protein AGDE_01001 [Angomonas deanei]CAD2217423.1 hypothetical protein, conserved [Angomonas deanei]|eukprot:EPY42922.1 hypothetical protein AGDE_01001 [Angomonas deanei]